MLASSRSRRARLGYSVQSILISSVRSTGSSLRQQRPPSPAARLCSNAAWRVKPIVQAVEAACACPFGVNGVIVKPAFELTRPPSGRPQIEACVRAHSANGGWIAEADWSWHATQRVMPGAAELPNQRSKVFPTRCEAIGAACGRMLVELERQLGSLAESPFWRSQATTLSRWVASVEASETAATDQALPLAGATHIDLYAGIGGIACGLRSLGARTILAVESSEDALDVYRRAWNPTETHPDIRTLDGKGWSCDLLTIGQPCQTVSQGGKKLGSLDPKSRDELMKASLRLIGEIRFKTAIVECAPGLLSVNGGAEGQLLKRAFMEAGCSVQHRVLDAVGFGGPQSRKRIFIVATRLNLAADDSLSFLFPTEQPSTARVADILQYQVPGNIDAGEIIFHTPAPPEPGRLHEVGLIGGRNCQGNRVYGINSVGPTLTASGGGRARFSGAYLIGSKARALTPREALRMQGFPEWFEHHPVHGHAMKQAGNAVSVPLFRELARNLAHLISPVTTNALSNPTI